MMNKKEKLLEQKVKKQNSIRVLYKQVGKNPRVRIIPNLQMLKQAIITKKLDIIPYQDVFIVCNNQDYMKTEPINIVFDFFHISGDVLIVQINKEKREFESLSQENIQWFTQDLIYRSFNMKLPKAMRKTNSNIINIEAYIPKKQKELVEDSSCNFETALIKALTNIELTLASSLLKNNKKGT